VKCSACGKAAVAEVFVVDIAEPLLVCSIRCAFVTGATIGAVSVGMPGALATSFFMGHYKIRVEERRP
jgi:hypothetical protein